MSHVNSKTPCLKLSENTPHVPHIEWVIFELSFPEINDGAFAKELIKTAKTVPMLAKHDGISKHMRLACFVLLYVPHIESAIFDLLFITERNDCVFPKKLTKTAKSVRYLITFWKHICTDMV